MSFLQTALLFDAQGRPLEAAWAYEISLSEPQVGLDPYLNLALLYFECRDFGFASFHHLSDEFISGARVRSIEILQLARDRFGDQTDILFWLEYFPHIYEENENIEQSVLKLADRKDSLIPFLYLFIASDRKEFGEEAKKLLEFSDDGSTQRKRYIKSVLE